MCLTVKYYGFSVKLGELDVFTLCILDSHLSLSLSLSLSLCLCLSLSLCLSLLLPLSLSLQWQECSYWSFLLVDCGCSDLWVSSPGENWLGNFNNPSSLECLCSLGCCWPVFLCLGLLVFHLSLQTHAIHWTLLQESREEAERKIDHTNCSFSGHCCY